jgi:hypothetical protein
MRMVAGLSGSTDMYLHLGKYLGLTKDQLEKVRAAALGTMIPAGDHSYHEIMVASQGYGLDYHDGTKGKGYEPFRPFDKPTLLNIAGVPCLPHEYLKKETKRQIKDSLDAPDQVLVARIPQRSELPAVGWKAKIQRGKSSYEKILALVDGYHEAAPADRFGLADGLVGAIDAWMEKNSGREHTRDDRKRDALVELRARALQAGTDALVHKEGAQAKARLTHNPYEDEGGEVDEDDTPGSLAFLPEYAGDLTPQGAVALEKLDKKIDDAVANPPHGELPALRDAPIYAALTGSSEYVELVAAVEAGRARRLVVMLLNAKGQGKVCKKLPDDDPDLVGFDKERSALAQVLHNFKGVDIHSEDVTHVRKGRFKLPGEDGGIRKALQGARGLTPEELDAINGYTSLEYKAFNDNTVAPERRQALISALAKLPKAPAPLFRGDYARGLKKGTTKSSQAFTSTSRSFEDSFISARPTAHVYVGTKSAAIIEGLSKKSWEFEALFPPTTFKVVAVIDKRARKDKRGKKKIDSTFDPDTNKLTGRHGVPTLDEQRRAKLGGRSHDLTMDVGFGEDEDQNQDVAKWYKDKFSDKTWVFWEEA